MLLKDAIKNKVCGVFAAYELYWYDYSHNTDYWHSTEKRWVKYAENNVLHTHCQVGWKYREETFASLQDLILKHPNVSVQQEIISFDVNYLEFLAGIPVAQRSEAITLNRVKGLEADFTRVLGQSNWSKIGSLPEGEKKYQELIYWGCKPGDYIEFDTSSYHWNSVNYAKSCQITALERGGNQYFDYFNGITSQGEKVKWSKGNYLSFKVVKDLSVFVK